MKTTALAAAVSFGMGSLSNMGHSRPSPVILSPFAVILSAAKNLALLRVSIQRE
jgi:hypothetical protein